MPRRARARRKMRLTREAATAFAEGRLQPTGNDPVTPIDEPGRPEQPILVAPRNLAQRGLGTDEGRAALVHAVAHIEFNAVNLAWDAVYRFRDMPAGFYADWVSVAADEARHFAMLEERLAELGHRYGDFPAHNGLWEMAKKTADSCLNRMALVPRVLEARGLDVTPGMMARLQSTGDTRTVAILDIILAEEVAHVAAGSRWFEWCCQRAGIDPAETFDTLLRTHCRGVVRGPFNRTARLAAGFSVEEMARLDTLVA
ncbi:ferritin-like domain-containing protein [Paucibacter sp. O1-1]|nr:ferritin-like domain-containing protein [Paucibacter sp. O1-1]MDA3830998.1 ferritin-like domain-containing protein [Paucibacter sp. O1-1]